jgi:uncharacterized protein with NRDE domain
MCLLLIANNAHKKYKLIIAANRDEFYERPAAAAAFWEDYPMVLAGKDLKAGGTWLGITKGGRVAAITNYRSGLSQKENSPSRGDLTKNFLISDISPRDYYEKIKKNAGDYNKFNLVFGTTDELFYYSNVTGVFEKIGTGVSGLSNCLLDTPWPKVNTSKLKLQGLLSGEPETSPLLAILSDPTKFPDNLLPDTGIPVELERYLSAVFIKTPVYGTRASTIIKISYENEVHFVEESFGQEGLIAKKEYNFNLNS